MQFIGCDKKNNARMHFFSVLFLLSNILVCKPGFYNSATNCISGCGHCKNGAICDNESGRCPGECELYFAAPYCQGTPKYNVYIYFFLLSLNIDVFAPFTR